MRVLTDSASSNRRSIPSCAAVAAVRRAGITLVLVTGRPPRSFREVLRAELAAP